MAYRSTERTEQHRAARSAALVSAGVQLVAAHGFAAATVAEVARRAGVSTGTVYTYFPEKLALTAAIFDRAAGIELDVVRAAVGFGAAERRAVPARDRIAMLVSAFGERALRGRTLAMALLFEPADVAVERERLIFRRAYAATVTEILADGMAEGSLPEQRLDLIAPAIVGALGEAFIRPLSPPVDATSADGAETRAVLDEIVSATQRLAGFAVAPRPTPARAYPR